MPTAILEDKAKELVDAGAQVVDVLPEGEYSESHLPGAVNIPLKKMTRSALAVLDKDRPVIVYCHDYQ